MKAVIAGMMLMTGCATTPMGPVAAGGRCDAAATQGLIGRPASSALAAEARHLSGAEMVRWLQPGQIVTMEFREGRLNITLDGANRVERITCG